MKYIYKIKPRPVELGGGWHLQLLADEQEVGGGMFPLKEDADTGMIWWNERSEQERAHWMMMAVSTRPADAYHAYLLAEAYAAAESTAYQWLNSRD